jgi:cyclophilin family peptidyl-prolyl cis-trans isomerase
MHKNVIAPLVAIGVLLIIGGVIFAQMKISANDEDIKRQEALLNKLESYGTSTDATGAPQNNQTGSNPPSSQNQQSINTNQKVMTATLHTNKGDITLEFFDSLAPKTVENFLKLASSGFYNGTKFHRVIKGFMIQGGDPLTKDDSQMARWGTGGPGYTFADEISTKNRNAIGTISMANSGPNTNGSQFFINTADNAFLDTKHTVFGRITAGAETVQAIEAVQTNASDRPLEPIIIKSITLQ